jgi:GMP synthase-like glutamine amidotransferase
MAGDGEAGEQSADGGGPPEVFEGQPEVVVLANEDDADPGLVGAALAARGYRLHTLHREVEQWPEKVKCALVVVLGSEWSVYDETTAESVDRERAYLAAAVGAHVPTLGICFGAQMLAAALGGEVHRADATELGWMHIEPEPGAPDEIEHGPWFQFHHDTFTLPPAARLLASSEVGPQAFQYGSALAVQFHPEVTPGIVGRWCAADPEPVAAAGTTAEELVAKTDAEQDRVAVAAARLVDLVLA